MMAKVKAIANGKQRAGKKGQAKPKKPASAGRRAGFLPSEQLWNIIERISDGFVAFDAQMNYIYVNQKGGEFLGRKPEDLVGKNYWMEYPEAKGTPFANAYLHALETQTPILFEDYYEPFERWFENRIYPSKKGLSIFFRDTTDHRLAEDSRRLIEEQYQQLLENFPNGTVNMYDRDLLPVKTSRNRLEIIY